MARNSSILARTSPSCDLDAGAGRSWITLRSDVLVAGRRGRREPPPGVGFDVLEAHQVAGPLAEQAVPRELRRGTRAPGRSRIFSRNLFRARRTWTFRFPEQSALGDGPLSIIPPARRRQSQPARCELNRTISWKRAVVDHGSPSSSVKMSTRLAFHTISSGRVGAAGVDGLETKVSSGRCITTTISARCGRQAGSGFRRRAGSTHRWRA